MIICEPIKYFKESVRSFIISAFEALRITQEKLDSKSLMLLTHPLIMEKASPAEKLNRLQNFLLCKSPAKPGFKMTENIRMKLDCNEIRLNHIWHSQYWMNDDTRSKVIRTRGGL